MVCHSRGGQPTATQQVMWADGTVGKDHLLDGREDRRQLPCEPVSIELSDLQMYIDSGDFVCTEPLSLFDRDDSRLTAYSKRAFSVLMGDAAPLDARTGAHGAQHRQGAVRPARPQSSS